MDKRFMLTLLVLFSLFIPEFVNFLTQNFAIVESELKYYSLSISNLEDSKNWNSNDDSEKKHISLIGSLKERYLEFTKTSRKGAEKPSREEQENEEDSGSAEEETEDFNRSKLVKHLLQRMASKSSRVSMYTDVARQRLNLFAFDNSYSLAEEKKEETYVALFELVDETLFKEAFAEHEEEVVPWKICRIQVVHGIVRDLEVLGRKSPSMPLEYLVHHITPVGENIFSIYELNESCENNEEDELNAFLNEQFNEESHLYYYLSESTYPTGKEFLNMRTEPNFSENEAKNQVVELYTEERPQLPFLIVKAVAAFPGGPILYVHEEDKVTWRGIQILGKDEAVLLPKVVEKSIYHEIKSQAVSVNFLGEDYRIQLSLKRLESLSIGLPNLATFLSVRLIGNYKQEFSLVIELVQIEEKYSARFQYDTAKGLASESAHKITQLYSKQVDIEGLMLSILDIGNISQNKHIFKSYVAYCAVTQMAVVTFRDAPMLLLSLRSSIYRNYARSEEESEEALLNSFYVQELEINSYKKLSMEGYSIQCLRFSRNGRALIILAYEDEPRQNINTIREYNNPNHLFQNSTKKGVKSIQHLFMINNFDQINKNMAGSSASTKLELLEVSEMKGRLQFLYIKDIYVFENIPTRADNRGEFTFILLLEHGEVVSLAVNANTSGQLHRSIFEELIDLSSALLISLGVFITFLCGRSFIVHFAERP